MSFSVAPEVRGTSFAAIPATLVLVLSLAFGKMAFAADLQRWSGDVPPSFTLPDTSGSPLSLDRARGGIVLVHFFATWCEPCREELPALNRLTARAGGAVKVVAISVAEVDLRVRRFLETMPLNFPVLLDRDRAVTKAWNVTTLPTTVVLDANLRPKLVVEEDFAWDTVDPTKLAAELAASARGGAAAVTTTPAIAKNTGG